MRVVRIKPSPFVRPCLNGSYPGEAPSRLTNLMRCPQPHAFGDVGQSADASAASLVDVTSADLLRRRVTCVRDADADPPAELVVVQLVGVDPEPAVHLAPAHLERAGCGIL